MVMRVRDIEIGDLVKITEKSRVRPLLIDSIGGARMIRWVENNTHNEEELKGEILLYIGPFRTGPSNRYKMHQFICKGEKCHIRCHNFRYLEKI